MTRTWPLASVTRRSSSLRVMSPGRLPNLEIGHRGVQMNRPGEVLHVHLAEDLAVQRDLALDFGERQVVAAPVGGDVAVDLVGREIALVGGEVHLHRPGDGVEVNIAVRRR